MLGTGDLLSIQLAWLCAALTVAALIASQMGWRHRIFIVTLYVMTFTCLLFGLFWPYIVAKIPSLDIKIPPAFWFSLIAFLVVLYCVKCSRLAPNAAWPADFYQNKSPDQPVAPVLVRSLFIVCDTRSAHLSCEHAVTSNRLRIFVDYSSYVSAMNFTGWTKRIRFPLGYEMDFVKGQRFQTPLISRTNDVTNKLCWGSIDNLVKAPFASDKYAARIVFIGQNDEEQYYNFIVFRYFDENSGQHLRIADGSDISIFNKWVEED